MKPKQPWRLNKNHCTLREDYPDDEQSGDSNSIVNQRKCWKICQPSRGCNLRHYTDD